MAEIDTGSRLHQRIANLHPTPQMIRRLIETIVVPIVIVSVVLLILWLVVRPHSPTVAVTTLTVTGFNLSGSKVSGEWDCRFRVFNLNRHLNVAYGKVVTSVFYNGKLLARTFAPSFSQGTRHVSVLEVRFSAVGADVDKYAAIPLVTDMVRGLVAIDVRLSAVVEYNAWWLLRARRREVRVLCKAVPISISGGSGNYTGGPRECNIFG